MKFQEGQYYVNPANAVMRPKAEWEAQNTDLNTLIEVSPVINDEEKVTGFGFHINLENMKQMEVIHPIILYFLDKTIREMFQSVFTDHELDQDEKMERLLQCRDLSEVVARAVQSANTRGDLDKAEPEDMERFMEMFMGIGQTKQ